jgi:hypothetical protein
MKEFINLSLETLVELVHYSLMSYQHLTLVKLWIMKL